MRDYGVVRVRFWDWAKRKKLSAPAREMALYLLTCPHGNSLGCFRLPIAYVRDDLDISTEEAGEALAALDLVGFIHRDAASGWIWIVDYLEHNSIPNGKVGKAAGKMLEQVPSTAAFYAELLASLHGLEHFPPTLIDDLRKRYLTSQDTVSRKSGTHTPTQTPTHDPTPTHEHAADDAREGPAQAFDAWNEFAATNKLPTADFLTSSRIYALNAVLATIGGVDRWRAGLTKAESAAFLKDSSSQYHGWFKLDWLLREDHFPKLLEGDYDKPRAGPGAASESRETWDQKRIREAREAVR